MTSSKVEFRRARPALGTLVSVRILNPPATANAVLNEAFARLAKWESVFSKFSQDSDLQRLNHAEIGLAVPVPHELGHLVQLALSLREASHGAFEIFSPPTPAPLELRIVDEQTWITKNSDWKCDLSGIAKGGIVDLMLDFLKAALPAECAIVVNAGGDLKFSGWEQPEVEIRLYGDPPRVRPLRISKPAVATSNWSETLLNPWSQTAYDRAPRLGLTMEHTVTALAEDAAVADALTKVGWFATPLLAQDCARKFDAQILVWDGGGDLYESF